tara:strand:- start:14428 stop:15600 length:1173 start_codon:yes stop_codon:yes gene_type:complete
MSNFLENRKIFYGPGSIKQIFEFLKIKQFNKVLLVLDKKLSDKSVYIKNFVYQFKKRVNEKKIVYLHQRHEPTYSQLDKITFNLKKKKVNKFDCIIGIGGGSTLDFSKGIALMLKNTGKSLIYRGFPKNINQPMPVIAVPSTTGTGSELAFNAVFTDKRKNIKLGINSKKNYPKLSILDPKVLTETPKSIILNSSLGAITRSIDTECNRKSNNISNKFSMKSFQLLFNNIQKILKNKNDLRSWLKMQWGSYYSVAALLNSTSGPAGLFSYYLSTNFNIPQGLGYAVSGFNLFKMNHEKGFYGYSIFYKLIKKKTNKKMSNKMKSKFVIDKLFQLLKKNKVKINFNQISKTDKRYKKLIHYFSDKIQIINSNNPTKLTKKDLNIVIQRILN